MKSGFVSIIGRPNVGKSTLLNQILGLKVAITSAKPQTTRTQIQGIYTSDEGQIVFIDTPGVNKPVHKLDEYMQEAASRCMSGVDKVLLLVEPGKPREKDLDVLAKLKGQSAEVILVINKKDSVGAPEILQTITAWKDLHDFSDLIPISAKTGEGVDDLLRTLFRELPEGPAYFPEDMFTDQPEKQLMAEFVREKALYVLQDEIPHGIAVVIDQFSEREDKEIVDIDATIICEKESHKPIILGKGGRTIKEIGTQARREMEDFLGCKVSLHLWVKIKERWRDSDFLIRNYGFDKKDLEL